MSSLAPARRCDGRTSRQNPQNHLSKKKRNLRILRILNGFAAFLTRLNASRQRLSAPGGSCDVAKWGRSAGESGVRGGAVAGERRS
eukprot:scaffold529_cov308-Pinguiococcus_pyrenoidosus.AAC.91